MPPVAQMPQARYEGRDMTRPRLLHLHSTFNLGGKEARAVQLMNAFGDRFEHDIVSAMPD